LRIAPALRELVAGFLEARKLRRLAETVADLVGCDHWTGCDRGNLTQHAGPLPDAACPARVDALAVGSLHGCRCARIGDRDDSFWPK
jgi:hypothetical protein